MTPPPYKEPVWSSDYAVSADNYEGADYPAPFPARVSHCIVKAVIKSARVPYDDLMKSTRGLKAVSNERQRIMFELRRHGLTTTRIGMILKRDHSTVVHGVNSYLARKNPAAE